MSDNFFTINKKKQPTNNSRFVTVYTFAKGDRDENESGYPIIELDRGVTHDEIFTMDNAYAIKLEIGTRIKYYVKRGRHGRLFNPIGLYSEGQSKKQLRHAGRPEWTFSECNERVFSYYIEFLKTRNAAWLNNAEREV